MEEVQEITMESEQTTELVKQAAIQAVSEGMALSDFVSLARVTVIKVAIRQSAGNQCKAARVLKSHRNTVSRINHENPETQ